MNYENLTFEGEFDLKRVKIEQDDLDESSTDNDDQQSICPECIFAQHEIRNVDNDSSPGF